MEAGDPDRTLMSAGPFTWIARCKVNSELQFEAHVLVATTEAGSIFNNDSRTSSLVFGPGAVG